MSKQIEKFKGLKGVLNLELISISRCQHYYKNKPNEDQGDMEIVFSSNTSLTFTLMPDGEQIDANIKEMVIPEAIEELDSKWERVVLTECQEYKSIKGTVLVDIMLIIDSFDGREVLAGVNLLFSSGDSLIYLNCGDTSTIFINDYSAIKPEKKDFNTRMESIA